MVSATLYIIYSFLLNVHRRWSLLICPLVDLMLLLLLPACLLMVLMVLMVLMGSGTLSLARAYVSRRHCPDRCLHFAHRIHTQTERHIIKPFSSFFLRLIFAAFLMLLWQILCIIFVRFDCSKIVHFILYTFFFLSVWFCYFYQTPLVVLFIYIYALIFIRCVTFAIIINEISNEKEENKIENNRNNTRVV